jgi:hypothetical protein
MAELDIIQRGELVKYIANSKREDFDFGVNDFHLEIIYGMRGSVLTIPKSAFLGSSEGYVFSFDTTPMVGRIKARLVMQIPDTDVPDSIRQEIDEQVIGFVVDTPCPKFFCCPCPSGNHSITYVRTEQSDITDKYVRLLDYYDRPLTSSEGFYLYALRDVAEQIQEILDNHNN